METTLNDEEKARQIRGAERESQCISNSNCDNQPRLKSVSSGSKSFRVNRDDSSPKFSPGKPEEITGKVLDELIHECLSQLECKKQEIKLIESKLENLGALRKEIATDNSESK